MWARKDVAAPGRRRHHVDKDAFGLAQYFQEYWDWAEGFTALAVAILALGIGANTAILDGINALLFIALCHN